MTEARPRDLAPAQRATWLLEQLVPGVTASSAARYLELPGVEPLRIAAVVEAVVAARPELAVACVVADGLPTLSPAPPLEVRRVEGLVTQQLLADLADEPFNLTTGPLTRAVVVDDGVVLIASELVADSASLGHLMHDVVDLLEDRDRSATAAVAPVDDETSIEWWSERLRALPAALDLPFDQPKPTRSSYRGGRFVEPLDPRVSSALQGLAERLGAGGSDVLMAAYAGLLYRLSSQDDLVIGLPTRRPDVEGAIGPWSPVLPIRLDVSGTESFADLVAAVRDATAAAKKAAAIPVDRLAELAVSIVGRITEPLTGVMFEDGDDGLPGTPVFAGRTSARADLVMSARADGIGWEHGGVLSEDAARAMAAQFVRILNAGLAHPDRALAVAPILDDADVRALRTLGTGAVRERPDWSVPERVLHWAAHTPAAVAVAAEGVSISYAELVTRSRRLALRMQDAGVVPGSRVGVCLDRSADLLVAFLAVWWAGASYVPVDPAYPADRVAMIFEDGAIAAVVTQESIRTSGPAVDCPTVLLAEGYQVPAPQPLAAEQLASLRQSAGADEPAYVIFTSGSTGRPKGVVISHGGLANLLAEMAERPGLAAGEVMLGVTTPAFDLSVPDWWLPLSVGATVYVAPPAAAADGTLLSRLLEETAADVLQATPSTWRLLLESGWTGRPGLRAVIGGEACSAPLASAIAAKVGVLYNFYGPTECTVWATCAVLESPVDVVTLGQPLANYSVYVVDSHLNDVPLGVSGELLIGGAGLALGYFERPDLTTDRFVDSPFVPGEKVYRTGDLVRWRRDRRLEFLGRIDQQVKVRGFRIELGEVEAALLSHPAVRQAVVTVREDVPADVRLVGYVVADSDLDITAVTAHAAAVLPAYMVPSAVVVLDQLPQTPNGKIDRKALPAPERGNRTRMRRDVSAPRTPVERVLAGVWEQVLGVDGVGVEDDFFALGGHSLLVLQVAARLPDLLGVHVPLRHFFERHTLDAQGLAVVHELLAVRMGARTPSLDALGLLALDKREALEAKLLRGGVAASDEVIKRRAQRDPAPVSSSQRRLWFLDQWSPGDPKYNAVIAVRLRGPVDLDRVRRAFDVVIERHEALRTVFPDDAGVPRQHVLDEWTFDIPVVDLRHVDADRREADLVALAVERARRPFNLRADLMVRVAAVQMADDETVLIFMEHHIAFDGWSDDVMFAEVAEVYRALGDGRAPVLPPLPVQYRDFALWQERRLSGERLERLDTYWSDHLAGAPAFLDMPLDKPRPQVQTFSGARTYLNLPAESAAGIRALARRQGATPYMALLALFTAALHRWAGADDICVGTPIAGRSRTEVEPLIGFFSNTLVLRTRPTSALSFAEHVAAVKAVALGAYEHQEMPFEKVVEVVKPTRDPRYNPLFQVNFRVQSTAAPILELPGCVGEFVEVDIGFSRFDLAVEMHLRDDGIGGYLEYNEALFEARTAQRFVAGLGSLLADALERPDVPIGQLTFGASATPFPGPIRRRR